MTDLQPITAKQFEVLEYIILYAREKLHQPSFREIANHFGISLGTVSDRITTLKIKGWISFGSQTSRALVISNEAQTLVDGQDERSKWVL